MNLRRLLSTLAVVRCAGRAGDGPRGHGDRLEPARVERADEHGSAGAAGLDDPHGDGARRYVRRDQCGQRPPTSRTCTTVAGVRSGP